MTTTPPAVGGALFETPAPPTPEPLATLTVYGDPTAQGSKTLVPGRGRAADRRFMVEGGNAAARARRVAWRTAVAEAAAEARDTLGDPLDGCLTIAIVFRHPMPASRSKRARDRGIAGKYTAPDIDKLSRSTLDGLKAGGLIVDDARATDLRAVKLEVVGWTGATITITRFALPAGVEP